MIMLLSRLILHSHNNPEPDDVDFAGDGTASVDQDHRSRNQVRGSTAATIHFLVLMPEYVQERVSINVDLPTTVETALRLVDQARDAQNRYRFGRLIPVDIQPALGAACLIAVPEWTVVGVPALFVRFAPPVRVFATCVPAILSAAGILQIAGETAPHACVCAGHAMGTAG